jgi:hypothetical protein
MAKGHGKLDSALKAIKARSNSEPAEAILKAAVGPATTTGAGWAAQLVQTSVADYLTAGLGAAHAGSALLRSALLVTQERSDTGTSVPSMPPLASAAGFVEEGAPIPVHAFSTSLVTLAPAKIASISVFTREMTQRSSFESVLRTTMDESAGLALDAALFGSAAAGASPAGLRNGVSAITAATGGGYAAMMRDLGALAGAVAAVAGDRIAFVGSPDVVVKLRLAAGTEFSYPVFASSALAAGTLMAIALPALVAAVDPRPEIEAGYAATLHMDNSGPLAIATPGSPATVAAPSRSLFQMDSIALRLAFQVTWALRASGAIAFVTSVSW